MSIEDRRLRATVLLGGEQAGQLSAFGGEVVGTGVEHLGDGSPSRPGGQGALLGQRRWTPGGAQGVHEFDGGDVRAGARFGAGGDQNAGAGGKVGGAAELLGRGWSRRLDSAHGGRGDRGDRGGFAGVAGQRLGRRVGRCRCGRIVNEILGEVVEE